MWASSSPLFVAIVLMWLSQVVSSDACRYSLKCKSGASLRGWVGFLRGVKLTESIRMLFPHRLEISFKTSIASCRFKNINRLIFVLTHINVSSVSAQNSTWRLHQTNTSAWASFATGEDSKTSATTTKHSASHRIWSLLAIHCSNDRGRSPAAAASM